MSNEVESPRLLIDESDVGEFTRAPKSRAKKPKAEDEPEADDIAKVEEEEIDLNLEAELAEASTKRIVAVRQHSSHGETTNSPLQVPIRER